MFDTMTFTKAFGALCGSLLVFLLIGLAGGALFHTGGGGEGGHGEETAQAYTIDTGAAADAGDTAAAGPTFEEVFATADPAAGEKVFSKCKACHKVDGTNGTGPHLNGVVGREHASVADFTYSDAMAAHKGETWTPEDLGNFLLNPKAAIPGTKMSFAGLPNVQDRANLVAWLSTQK